MPTPEEILAKEEKARQVEWNTYVATEPIFIGGIRAFNEGHAVPVSHVKNGVVPEDAVKKVPNSESAAAAADKPKG